MTALDWIDKAACAGIPHFTEASVVEQHLTCAGCPVRRECRDFAKATSTDRSVMYGGRRRQKRVTT